MCLHGGEDDTGAEQEATPEPILFPAQSNAS